MHSWWVGGWGTNFVLITLVQFLPLASSCRPKKMVFSTIIIEIHLMPIGISTYCTLSFRLCEMQEKLMKQSVFWFAYFYFV